MTKKEKLMVIFELIENKFKFTKAQIITKDRHRPLADIRQIAMVIAYKCTKMSLPELGRVFKRDHSTVLHAKDKYDRNLRKSCKGSRVFSDEMVSFVDEATEILLNIGDKNDNRLELFNRTISDRERMIIELGSQKGFVNTEIAKMLKIPSWIVAEYKFKHKIDREGHNHTKSLIVPNYKNGTFETICMEE